jgi:uncharacterized protein YbjQ (UPF0145 family)
MTEPEIDLAGLPVQAVERLRELQETPDHGAMFTSDLSVNEFVLVQDAGFEPVGLVVGSSIYHVGIQWANWSANRELDVLTQAMYHARELAIGRMEAEATALGADGVVGVRLDINFYQWGNNLAEFIAIGTAVKGPGRTNWKTPKGLPFTSDLNGQDFWTLLQTGHRPLALVLGTCVYHVGRRRAWQTIGTYGRNVELPNYTQALYSARELAMERMQHEAHNVGASGVVGVQITEKNHVWGHHAIEYLAVGTAVAPYGSRRKTLSPQFILNLDE